MRTHGTTSGYKNGCRCPECKEAGRRANREREIKKTPRIPIDPMIEALPESFSKSYAKSIKVWKERGISVFIADKICCMHGLHPSAVYGDDWFWKRNKKELQDV